ncbi:MAG: ribose 5-phosphate isomerase B [Candidatus Kapaibacterium sp.]|jgi:ribose 5-phosphate isomerase B|nr:ribose 5-phosphate isomerase B [Candidatus Kapabacteria bacterium]
MKIAIASDHAGFELKEHLRQYLSAKNHQVIDFGTYSIDSTDYPDYAFPASEAVAKGNVELGILVCGTGTGMSITANKVQGVRAASCTSIEMAELARSHNNANVLAVGSRLISKQTAEEIVQKFIETDFEGGRHSRRVEKIHTLTRG